MHFKFMAPGILQHNGHVKQKFTTLFGRVWSMLNHVKVFDTIRKGVWAEAGGTATLLNVAIVTTTQPVATYVLFYGTEKCLERSVWS
jgi:hypothetical protein